MNMFINRRSFGIGIFAAGMSTSVFAISAPSAESFAKRALDDLQKLVNTTKTGSARHAQTSAFFRKYSDVPTIARTVIGASWRGMNDDERSAYIKAFEGYIVRKYSGLFSRVKGGQVEMLGSNGGGSAGVRVNAQFIYPGENPYKVQFHVVDGSNGPVIMDLRVLGVSLISTERAQIRRLLGEGGNAIDSLVVKLNRI